MNIYVYEPYKWDYCGGAIVVIAKTKQRAQELIWERQKQEHELHYPNGKLIGRSDLDYSWEALKDDRKERFKTSKDDGNCWELTSIIKCYTVQPERVICFNYNYG